MHQRWKKMIVGQRKSSRVFLVIIFCNKDRLITLHYKLGQKKIVFNFEGNPPQ